MSNIDDSETFEEEASEDGSMSVTAPRKRRLICGDEPAINRFDPERAFQSIARFAIEAGLNFKFVDHFSFHNLVEFLNPQFSAPSSETLKQLCMDLYEEEKKKLMKSLADIHGRTSITISRWSDTRTHEYMCLSAHYIDNDWKLRRVILNFKLTSLEESDFSDTLLSCLAEWKIAKVFSMTLDSPIVEDVTPLHLKNRLNTYLLPNDRLLNVPCHAHIFNLLVREVMDHIHNIFQRIREATMYTERDEVYSKFYMMAKEMKLKWKKRLDYEHPSHWHTSYLMLENALRFQEVFAWLQSVDSSFTVGPTADDWIKVREACRFLKLYHKAAKLFSNKSTTADLYFIEIWKICMHLCKESKSSDNFISSLAGRMQAKFNEYWRDCYEILAIAMVLNPRHKMPMVKFCFQKLYGDSGAADPYINCVRDGIQKLFDEYESSSLHDMETMGHGSSDMEISNVSSLNGDSDQFDVMLTHDYKDFLDNYYLTHPPKTELEEYLAEKVLSSEEDKFDVLHFWRLNEYRFPKLAKLARDVLAIPIVSVRSQSTFHIGNKVLDASHTYMGEMSFEEMVLSLEGMICTQNWLQTSDTGSILDCGMDFDEDEDDGDFLSNEDGDTDEGEGEDEDEDEDPDFISE